MSFNDIGCSGAHAVSEGLMNNKVIRYMNLYGNIIDVEGALHIATLIG